MACKTYMLKIRKFLMAHQFTRAVSNMVEIGAGLVLVRLCCIGNRKIRFGTVWWNPWGNFPKFFNAKVHYGPRFPPNPSRFWGLITKKPSTIPKHTCVYLWSNFCIIIQRSISLHFVQFGNSTRLTGTSYGPVSVCLSVTSWCSIIKSDKNINLVLGMDVSFDQSYTVF